MVTPGSLQGHGAGCSMELHRPVGRAHARVPVLSPGPAGAFPTSDGHHVFAEAHSWSPMGSWDPPLHRPFSLMQLLLCT